MVMRVTFQSGALELEGELAVAAGSTRAAVICHPHPQYGGDMDNSVVCVVAAALRDAGHATLRFNFRGVGASGGSYDGGVGEVEDARAAVRYLCTRAGSARVILAGYSFGAIVALRAGVSEQVDALIAVAPPLASGEAVLADLGGKRKLFILGDRDQFCTPAMLQQALTRVAEPKTVVIAPGVDHFWAGGERMLAQVVQAFAK